ncbi:TIGR00266 family protein [Eubacterium limosum]|uniref:TIGR00266 family protein n=1 Tax=Eubacterium limosum TaxID=1736 RepID=A0ABT5UST4_EUBLI|nr:TIGR00266 family protein [Eubacterium limosum]MCB6570916.1 TIGR00266 family protein [Eubacterium limosum]MDE1472009.1 TIGR00266 family protein [Eubacterium limosum]
MKYEIIGDTLPVVELVLDKGEQIYTESGGMSWMDPCFDMETSTRGGALKAIKRSFSGNSLFLTTYTCQADKGRIAFSASFPGNIRAVHLEAGQSIICAKTAFLAAEESVDFSIFFKKSVKTGVFGGAGFILQKLTGPGLVFLELNGTTVEYTLEPGQQLNVDQGHIAVFEEKVSFDVTQVKGAKNILFSGEGLFFATLTGPGRVVLQSMPVDKLAKALIPYMPTSTSS